MRITQGMHEIARLQVTHLGHHQRQQRIGSNIERHAEEDITAALIQLTAQLAVGYIELKQAVARRQRLLARRRIGIRRDRRIRQYRRVPGADHQASRVRVALDFFQHLADLVNHSAVRGFPATPLLTINRAQLALRGRPAIPDGYPVFFQVTDIGVTGQEPQQLVNNRAQVQFLGGEHGETLAQVVTHLIAKHRIGAGTGTVFLVGAVLADVTKQIKILLHDFTPRSSFRYAQTSMAIPRIIIGMLSNMPMVNQPPAR